MNMGRTACCHEPGLKKGAWTADEDRKLIAYIQQHGEGGWRILPQKAGLKRCGKSCRLRWANYLKPDIKRGDFSPEEEHKIIQLHASMGNRWSAIARHLPRRTDNEIKNHWNTYLKKRLPTDCHCSTNSSRPCSTHIGNKPKENPVSSQQLKSSQKDDPSSTLARPVSASARLLNKMATNLSHSSNFHRVDKLKSILSTITGYQGNVLQANNDRLTCSASPSSLSSTSISASSVGTASDQATSINHDSLDQSIDLFDFDVFRDWQEATGNGVLSTTSMSDTHDYNLESPASNYPPGISAYDEWTALMSEP